MITRTERAGGNRKKTRTRSHVKKERGVKWGEGERDIVDNNNVPFFPHMGMESGDILTGVCGVIWGYPWGRADDSW